MQATGQSKFLCIDWPYRAFRHEILTILQAELPIRATINGVRITVSHTKSKEEVKHTVDRSFDDFFRGLPNLPVQIVDEKRAWNGDTLYFSFGAKVSLLTSPIKGTIVVTDRDITIDADLGLLEKLLPAAQAKATLENRVRGLLT